MKRLILILNSFIPFFVALFIQSLVYLIITILYTYSLGISEPSLVAEHYISITAVAVCGIVFVFWYRSTSESKINMTMDRLLLIKSILILILLGIGEQFFISGVMHLTSPYLNTFFVKYSETVDSILTGNPVIVMIYVIFIAPVTEELIFRGMILNRATLVLPFMGANLLQAAAFGLYHGNVLQGVFSFAVGLLLGMVYLKYQTLLAPILLHMATNAASYLIGFVPKSLPEVILATLASGLVLLVCLRIIFKKSS